VPGAKLLRDDQVEALAKRFLGRVSEDSLGTGVPQADDAVAIGHDDGVRGVFHDLAAQPTEIRCFHSSALLISRLLAQRRRGDRDHGSGLFLAGSDDDLAGV
jgi:hypothetical protein